MRLDKFLCETTGVSRSDAKKLVRAGRVSVDNQVAKSGDTNIKEDIQTVCLDGNELCYEQFRYYILYKPAGCVTALTDGRYPTVMEYLRGENLKDLSPVGRLDLDTEGLLLITNDGQLSHRLLSPAHHVPKTYFARLDKPVPKEAIERMKEGLDIGDDKPTLPAELVIDENDDKSAYLTITEGRYHQVKRMFEVFGCTVVYLKRLNFGKLTLGDLKPGEYKKISIKEVE